VRALIVVFTLVAAGLSWNAPAVAQEGHPLKGSWIGTWGPSKVHGDDLLMVLNWDGKVITGMINPGTDNIPIKTASLTPEGWVVRIQAEGKTESVTLEGKIENVAMHNRTVTGTWKSAKESGKFQMQRQ
jgi:hypothetical protein